MFFTCIHCHKKVSEIALGTKNRNHCSFCLYSKHVDKNIAGDRLSKCFGAMKPISLTFKKTGVNKFSDKPKSGEIMIVHLCVKCGKININRIAGDDEPKEILKVFKKSRSLDLKTRKQLKVNSIKVLNAKDEKELLKQLFGNLL